MIARRMMAKIAGVIAVVAMGPLAVSVAYADDPASTAADSGTSATAPATTSESTATTDSSNNSAVAPAADTPVTDAASFLDAAFPCAAGQTKRVVIAGDINVTTASIRGIDTTVACQLTLVSDGSARQFTWTGSRNLFNVTNGGSLTIGDNKDEKLTVTNTDGVSHGSLVHLDKGALTINGGTFSKLQAKTGTVAENNGGTVTINNGSFTGHVTTEAQGGIVHQQAGSTVINDGTFSGNKGVRGSVIANESGDGKIEIHGGAFTNNESSMAAGVIMQNSTKSTMVVDGGTFTDNSAGTKGGVIHNNGTLTVTSNDKGATPLFKNNTAKGNGGNEGGGAISQDQGEMIISGGRFIGNHTVATAYMSGGGAVYAQGTLTVSNKDGVKPLFDGNWAGTADANTVKFTDDTDDKTTAGTTDTTGTVGHGGAGGAIFLQNGNSMGYILGGEYVNNTSGYLGGAIYTEEGSTTYVAPAVATLNKAGHFGGGLWLCPSGNANASQGGNIALLNNTVDESIDENTDNHAAKAGFPTEAGDDLSIMNPGYKSQWGITYNAFELLNTWFTNRDKAAVTWYWDGQPLTSASGFADKYQDPSKGQGAGAVRVYDYGTGVGDLNNYDGDKKDESDDQGTDGRYKRYDAKSTANTVQEPTLLQQAHKDGKKHGIEDTNGGIALKAVPTSDANLGAAWSSARVTFKHNAARLSGGAFGSNGRVIFATPDAATWSKIDADTKTVLAGSKWKVSGPGAYQKDDLEPANCLTLDEQKSWTGGDADRVTYTLNYCWHYEYNATTHTFDSSSTPSMIVTDNTGSSAGTYVGKDMNPEPGVFSIDNLADGGRFTLTEIEAPVGYQLSDRTYTFTAQGDSFSPQISVTGGAAVDGNRIGNSMYRVEWSKADAADAEQKPLGGSEWTLTRQGSDFSMTITECVPEKDGKPDKDGNCPANIKDGAFTYADQDKTDGKFSIRGLDPGTYTLQEKTAPAGYDLNPNEYTFTVPNGKTAGTGDVVLHPVQGSETNGVITDDKSPVGTLKVTKTVKNGTWNNGIAFTFRLVPASGSTGAPLPSTGCVNQNTIDEDKYCDLRITGNGTDLTQTATYGEIAFKDVTKRTDYRYTITEIGTDDKPGTGGAQGGLAYSKDVWNVTVTVDKTADAGQQVVVAYAKSGDSAGSDSTAGAATFVNVGVVSSLPFTGGNADARSWMLVGGGIALLGLASAVVYAQVRRRSVA